jgi:hypothetical protein
MLLASSALAARPDDDEPPVVGQPAGFDGAVGSYQISARAQPTELQAEDPLTFTLRVNGTGRQPPRRPNLRKAPAFVKRFAIEDLPDPDTKPGAGVWEFRYRLKPLQPAVTEIPPLRFDYYKPGIIPREKGYRTTYSPSIPLTVKPRSAVPATEIQGAVEPSQVPESFFQLAAGPDAVLRHDEPFAFPGLLSLVLALLVPPALCGGWYLLWRYLDPDAARQTRQRQSRAARQALHELHVLSRGAASDPANQVAATMTDYFRQRWDLSAAEPTPDEVSALLHQHGCTGEAAEQAAAFFRACDVARFAPDHGPGREELIASAVRLIGALEGQP